MSILSNDIKKGMQITAHGARGIMFDNMRGNIRTVKVDSVFGPPSIGSCYVWDITSVMRDGKIERVELTEKQKKSRLKIKALGF